MKRALALVAFAGCLDKPSYECLALEQQPSTQDATLGTSGGVPMTEADCGTGDYAIGVGVAMTAGIDTMVNDLAVVGMFLACATVENHDDVIRYEQTYTQSTFGGGGATGGRSAATTCSPGEVVVGIEANVFTPSSGDRLNSIAIHCQGFDLTGKLAGTVTPVPVTSSAGVNGFLPSNAVAACGFERALHGVVPHAGDELDQLELLCARSQCMLP